LTRAKVTVTIIPKTTVLKASSAALRLTFPPTLLGGPPSRQGL
jgi:hypothetical protein